MKTPRYKTPVVAPQRLVALADGVFAIVMTILVLELSIPIIAGTSVNTELTRGLLEMWPEFLIYGLSFLVLGMFWLMHHAVFDNIRVYDTTLSWMNIIFLMFIALTPFSTSLFGEYRAEQSIALVYGANLLLPFSMLWAMFSYATGNYRLVNSDINPGIVKGGKIMGVVYCIVILIGLGISFITPIGSFIMYGLIVVVFIIATILGKWEIVMVWPPTR